VGDLGWDGLTDWQRFRMRLTGTYTAYIINRTARQCVEIVQHARLGEPVPPFRSHVYECDDPMGPCICPRPADRG
jgi:hypothetical protein